MKFKDGVLAAGWVAGLLFSANGEALKSATLKLSADGLYAGRIARNIRMDTGKKSLVLDNRNRNAEFTGEIETDAIDALDPENAKVTEVVKVKKVSVKIDVDLPAGTRMTLSIKNGPTLFSGEGWLNWVTSAANTIAIDIPSGRYVKIRCQLTSDKKELSPRLMGAEITLQYEKPAEFKKPLKVVSFKNEKIMAGATEFGYERPDHPVIKSFVEQNKLGEVVKDKPTEIEKFYALTDWVAKTPNTRNAHWETDYPWDVQKLCTSKEGQLGIEGHCMSYAVVLVTALTGLGYPARHWAMEGFRVTDHEVVEAWSNDLKKWVYLDPSLSQHYLNPKTKEPLSLLEMHNIYVNTFFKKGEDLTLPMEEQKKRVKTIGGKNAPIICVDGGFHYGKEVKDYDWGWLHGYLSTGYLRLTTRNDFHSHHEPWFSHFGEGLSKWNVFLSWTDEKTPVWPGEIKLFSGRERDFYWTLNQAAFKATRDGDTTLSLEFGNSQPFFKEYRVSVDQGQEKSSLNTFTWGLHPGENTFKILPVDEWGKRGISSTLVIKL